MHHEYILTYTDFSLWLQFTIRIKNNEDKQHVPFRRF
jgi:hypothetical protein